ncbi:MAG: L,D-transpeptidase family protein [Gammaproteobacteria bacterium]|nr:L,D-transpeptidase family protein [Gammaproteobacteria bacterium]
MVRLLTYICFLITLIAGHSVYASQRPEQRLLDALQLIQSAQPARAEQLLKNLIDDEPEFKLAHMLYADLLKARTGPLDHAGMGLSADEELQQLLTEVKKRWQASLLEVDEQNKIPAVLTRLDDNYFHAIAVDLKQSRLFVFENYNGYPKQVDDFFISMGRGGPKKQKEGDLRTPLGVYFVQSYIPPQKLADKYGSGAYPINYPNAWDLFKGRTGNGIWLHGTRSGTYNRPPLASEGCVVLPNDDLLEVGSYINLAQTPVLIGYDLKWLSREQWQAQKQQVSDIFNQWVADWQSLNTESYLSHYSKDFSNGKKDFNHWVAHKRRVAQHKTFVEVEASDVSLLMHPNEDVLVATFNQKYASDNYRSQSWKRQYWHKEDDGKWRIIFEGEISAPATPQLAKRSL